MFENLWKDYQNKIAVQKFPLSKKIISYNETS